MKKEKIYSSPIPPALEKVKVYFSQKGMSELEAEHFFMFYQIKEWRSKKGNLLTNWKSLAHGWIMAAMRINPILFNKNIH